MSAPSASQGSTDAGRRRTAAEFAAEHATRRVPMARPGQSAGEVRDAIVGSHRMLAVVLAEHHEDLARIGVI